MKLVGKLIVYPLLAVNWTVSLMLIFSCYGSLAAPIGKWPFASLSGLVFPILFIVNILFLILWLPTWRKASLLPLATILICIVPTFDWCPIHPGKKGKVTEPYLTVMTYNTEGFGIDDNKDWTLNNPVLNYILEKDADIVLLQEATKDMMRKVSKNDNIKKKYPYFSNPKDITGVAFFSKFPVISHEPIRFEDSHNRCQYIRILVNNDTLAVFNCHLQSNHLKDDELSDYRQFIENPTDSTHYKGSKRVIKKLLQSTSLRAGQARMISDMARNETANYVIVCGDFNDTPLSYSHRLFDRFMTDAYSKTGNGPGATYHEHKLYYRIDHIFCSKNITPLYTWIDRTQKDSDHYPVISKIQLQK